MNVCAICWNGFINQVEQVKKVIDHIQMRSDERAYESCVEDV